MKPQLASSLTRMGTNSDKSSSAQFVDMCSPVSSLQLYLDVLNSKVFNNVLLPSDFRYLVWVMYYGGLRVSEALAIKRSHLSASGRLFVPALKRSNSRVVVIPNCAFFVPCQYGFDYLLFDHYNRFFVYRELKRLGVHFIKAGCVNKSVTHSLRGAYALECSQVAIENNAVSHALGHKNSNNVKYYQKQINK